MGRFSVVWVVGLAATLAACGSNVEESAATGGLGGAAVGAAVGGPVGAAVGLGVGAGAGVGVEVGQERGLIPPEPGDRPATASAGEANRQEVRNAQTALRDQGLYRGPIDGIDGPETKQAVAEFQRRQGLPQTASLDRRTLDAINGSLAALPPERGPREPR